MSKINQLSAVSVVGDADAVPIYSSGNGDARKASLSVIANYLQTKVTARDDKLTQYSAPATSGFTVQINDDNLSVWLILTPSDNFASGTIKLPLLQNCQDRQEILITCTKAITTLTVNPNGSNIIGVPSRILANESLRLRFDNVTQSWFVVDDVDNGTNGELISLSGTSYNGDGTIAEAIINGVSYVFTYSVGKLVSVVGGGVTKTLIWSGDNLISVTTS